MGSPVAGPPEPSEDTILGSRARRALDWLLPEDNPAGLVYGVVVIGALMAAESGRHEAYADTLGSAVIAAALYWLAHAYASLLGSRLASGEHLTVRALWAALAHDLALVRGAAIPLAALLIAWAAGAERETGEAAALWCAVGSVIALELAAGIRSRATRRELALELGVGIALGLGILALRVLLHH